MGWEELEDLDPATGEVAALVPLCGAGRFERRSRRRERRSRSGGRCRRSGGRGRCWRCARGWWRGARSWSRWSAPTWARRWRTPTARSGAGIESVESAAAIPHLLKGERLEGVAAGVDVEMVRQPVGVVAAITPFNFPAMIPLWFLPLRDRLRQLVPPQALGAGPAAGGADHGDRRLGRGDPAPASSTWSTAAATRSTRSWRTRASTRSPSSGRPRRRGSSPKGRCGPASGCRRWAAPRTRLS